MTFVGVPSKDDLAGYRDFVSRHDLANIVHAIDPDRDIWSRFGVGYQPAWVLINQDGSVEVIAGALGGDALRMKVDALLDA